MKIAIRNYLTGSYLLASEPKKWDAIVILDSNTQDSSFVAEHCSRFLFLRFDDIVTHRASKRLPTTDDISSALEFATESTNLMVCCRAGQSRSAALAFVIAFEKLGSAFARKIWNPRRHIPNPLILEIAAQLIDEPTFLASYYSWLDENRGTSLTDYLDEIEAEYDNLESAGARNRITEP